MEEQFLLNRFLIFYLSAAVKSNFSQTLVGSTGSSKSEFYCDFLFKKRFSQENLAKLEQSILNFQTNKYEIIVGNKLLDQEIYRQKLQNKQLKKSPIFSLVHKPTKKVIFTDFSDAELNKNLPRKFYFKLLDLSGAYWNNNASEEQFTRIHGTVWSKKADFDHFLSELQKKHENDHRYIGKDLGIFTFDILAGQGLPIWLENGMIIKNEMQKYIRHLDKKYLFKEVSTPILGDKKLYQISGHLDHYADTMFPPIKFNNEQLILRPMTCPHHILLYQQRPRIINEFPIRYSEQAMLYRYEKSGALSGLERARSMELTEGHVFITKNQITSEFKHCFQLITEALAKFKIKIKFLSLSLHDPADKEKYFDDQKMWLEAENDLRMVLNSLNIDFKEEIGEAAFYGPKVDIQVATALGKEVTLSTIQLDFLLPQRFGLKYFDQNDNTHTPILLHRGLIGTYERMIAILLEQNKGNLPFWLSPQQMVVIPINLKYHTQYAEEIYKILKNLNYRITIDKRAKTLSKKIHDAQTNKIKYQIIIGNNEIEKQVISIRKYGEKDTVILSIEKFITNLEQLK